MKLRDHDAQRFDLFTDFVSKVAHAGYDLRDAVGGQDVRDCRDNLAIGNAQPVQRDDAQVRGAVHDHNIIIVKAGFHCLPKQLNRVVGEVFATGRGCQPVLHVDQVKAGRKEVQRVCPADIRNLLL